MSGHPFDSHLEDGEQLRWVGRPQCARARRSIKPARMFAFALAPVAVLFWAIAVALDFGVVPVVLAVAASAIPLLGLYLPTHDRRHLAAMRFAVTDRAALVSTGDKVQRFAVDARQFQEFMDGDLHNLRIGRKAGRFQVVQGTSPRISVPVAFEMLSASDAREAKAALAPLLGTTPPT